MIAMNQACRGSIIVFKPNRTCKQWFLGIVSGLFYQMRVKKSSDPEDVLQVFQWNGDLQLFDCDDWQSMRRFISYKSFDLSCVEMYFVNQVCT